MLQTKQIQTTWYSKFQNFPSKVSEVKQQTYNQDRLKQNFQIIMKELRSQRDTINGLKYLEKENSNLKHNLTETNQSLSRLIDQLKSQQELLQTQTNHLNNKSIEIKDKQDELERKLNQQQNSVQIINDKSIINDKTHDNIYVEINLLVEKQSQIKEQTQQIIDNTKQDLTELKLQVQTASAKTQKNSNNIYDVEQLLKELKKQYESIQQSQKSMDKKIITIENSNTELNQKVEKSSQNIENNSANIKQLQEIIKEVNKSTQTIEQNQTIQGQQVNEIQILFTTKNEENAKQLQTLNDELSRLKLLVDTLSKQLKSQGNFITKELLKKSLQDLKDYQQQITLKLQLNFTQELESLRNQIKNLPKQLTDDEINKMIQELLQKAADKAQTKRALLYLENLFLQRTNNHKTVNGAAIPFTTSQLVWSPAKCANCLDSGKPGNSPTGCCHGCQYPKLHNNKNSALCCPQPLKVNLEKSFSQLYLNDLQRPTTSKNKNNHQQQASLTQIASNSKIEPAGFMLNVDLDILPTPKNQTIKTVRYEDKKFYKTKKEMDKIDHMMKSQITYRQKNNNATVEV